MTLIEHKPCYGTMFPDPRNVSFDGANSGKVFSLVVVSPPGLCRAARDVEVNLEEWDDCTQCPEFDSCYKLSVARSSLENAVAMV